MSTKTADKQFHWSYLFIGIAFVIISLVALRNPAGSLATIVLLFGVVAISKGVFEVVVRSSTVKLVGGQYGWSIVVGMIDIILGIYLLFNLDIGISILPYVFSIWFIVDSVGNLVISRWGTTGMFWLSVVVNTLGVILGFILLFNPFVSAVTLIYMVSFYLMLIGILFIVDAFQ